MSVSDAVQWLLEHEEDEDIDVPLPGMEASQNEEGATGGALAPDSPESPTVCSKSYFVTCID